jgi:hypothetical protein
VHSIDLFFPEGKDGRAVAATSVEVEISGPRLIKRGDTLHFRAFLTNRSPETVIVRAPNGMLQASMSWKTTDSAGKELPPPHWEGVYCPVTSMPSVGEGDFVALKGGERIEIPLLGDLSDMVLFPGKRFLPGYVALPVLSAKAMAQPGRHADIPYGNLGFEDES